MNRPPSSSSRSRLSLRVLQTQSDDSARPGSINDAFFCRCLRFTGAPREAHLLWDLVRLGVTEHGIQTRQNDFARRLKLNRKELSRALEELWTKGFIDYVRKWGHSSQITLRPDLVAQPSLIQLPSRSFQGLEAAHRSDRALARLALLIKSPTSLFLVVRLAEMGAIDTAIRCTTRQLEQALAPVGVSRTAARHGLNRLAESGLVAIQKHADSASYRLLEQPLRDLVAQPCPLGPDAAAWTPGWSDDHFPLLDKLEAAARAIETARESSAGANQPPSGADNLEQS